MRLLSLHVFNDAIFDSDEILKKASAKLGMPADSNETKQQVRTIFSDLSIQRL